MELLMPIGTQDLCSIHPGYPVQVFDKWRKGVSGGRASLSDKSQCRKKHQHAPRHPMPAPGIFDAGWQLVLLPII
jgi:hypothetical protein